MRFSKNADSLKNYGQFKAVYQEKNVHANRHFVMYVRNNGQTMNRLGISVSKKVGNSVVRHRIARLVRESYRLHENMFNSGLDIVVVVRESAAQIGFHEAEKSFLHLMKLHQLIQ